MNLKDNESTYRQLRNFQREDLEQWRSVLAPKAYRALEDAVAAQTKTVAPNQVDERVELNSSRWFEIDKMVPRGQRVYEILANQIIPLFTK